MRMRASLTPVQASLLASVLFLVVIPACSSSTTDPGDGKVSVVTAFYPLQEAAERVGDDHVDLTNLTAPGVEPHDLELTPRAVQAISEADVVLYLGDGFQPAVEDAVKDAQGTTVDLLANQDTAPPPAGSEAGLIADPHVWLDPTRYAAIVGQVADAFADVDPTNAHAYRANAARFQKELSTLDAEYRTGLEDCARDLIVTNHAAFGYLAAAYGLRQEAISGLSPEAEPSADRLVQLRDLVQREGITTIFTEELVSPKVAETLASEAGVQTAVLHTLEGLTSDEASAGADYASLMRENLQTLRSALGCA
jgi:zinc transport system substrate-binding protein